MKSTAIKHTLPIHKYESIYVDGYNYKASCLFWDKKREDESEYNPQIFRYGILSFPTKQQLDNCLSLFQKGIIFKAKENIRLRTIPKSYLAKCARSKDENLSDGYHALIYDNSQNIIRVYKDENAIDKVFDWLQSNIKSGLLEEWKAYFFNELIKLDLLTECVGFDYTDKGPKVFLIDKILDTDIIRNIKSTGLKNGDIRLNVPNIKKLDPSMSFLDVITELIIPYIENQDCHYNLGDEISPFLNNPIIVDGKKNYLFPKQKIIAQGLLNAIKSNIPYVIFNGGTGLGKTFTAIELSFAILNEKYKRSNGILAISCQSHLIAKWEREVNQCLNPIGIYPKFHVINHFSDCLQFKKDPSRIDILIFPKDLVKRKWLIENSMRPRFNKNLVSLAIESSLLSNFKLNNSDVIVSEYKGKLSAMKLTTFYAAKRYDKKIILYLPILDNNNTIVKYLITTTSSFVKNSFGTRNLSYDFTINSLDELIEFLNEHSKEIADEKKIKFKAMSKNYCTCPICGGANYKKINSFFSSEDRADDIIIHPDNSMNNQNRYCNNYLRANGTPLSKIEEEKILNGSLKYIVINKKLPYYYINDDNEPITNKELMNVKKNPSSNYTILIKKCGNKLWGAKDMKGYRTENSLKFWIKKFGKKSIDILIQDEAHQVAGLSNQGQTFAYACMASKEVIPLTGTLTGGKSSDLFYLLFRLSPKTMIKNGYDFNSVNKFIEHFGRRKQETIYYQEEKFNKSGTNVVKPWREIPGISSNLYKIFLCNHMVSRKIEDLEIPLPKLRYFKAEVEMTDELKRNYNDLQSQMKSFISKFKGISIGGSYLNNLLAYCDMPNQDDIVLKGSKFREDLLIAKPAHMDINNILLPKEKKLIETIKNELRENRRVLVYVTFTGEKGVGKRLLNILSKYFKVAELGSKIKLEKREEWIEKQYKKGIEVIITNPECVSTGLNIIQYPSIYFYELCFNIRTLRQAEKRAYRPNATRECRIWYSYYKDTMQEDAVYLCSAKKRASLSLEGVFSEDALSALSESDESIESMLNNILKGKVVLRENSIDDFFENENVIDVPEEEIRKVIDNSSNLNNDVTSQSDINLSVFVADDDCINKKRKKTIDGQFGFIF